jgi:hypothetical protein
MIKLGALLKRRTNCKLIVNLHDPVDYTTVRNLSKHDIPHVNRDKIEREYILECDFLITTSELCRTAYITKYPALKNKSKCIKLGYIEDIKHIHKLPSNRLRIIYGGNCGWAQAPQILAKATCDIKGVETTIIGDYWKNPALLRYRKHIRLLKPMQYHDFCRFAMKHADVSFISLRNDYYGVCIPSKLYESINLQIPMLAAIPDGDAKDIINSNGYGIACSYGDINQLRKAVFEFMNHTFLARCQNNIAENRTSWSALNFSKSLIATIKQIQLGLAE